VNIVFRNPSSRLSLINGNIFGTLQVRFTSKDVPLADIFPLARLALHLANEPTIMDTDKLLTKEWILVLGDVR
jgi:hypothetical protein